MISLSIGILEKHRDARIKELHELGSVLQGTLTTLKRTCGKTNCKCSRGEKHTCIVLSKKVNGKTKCLYIPKDMIAETEKWVKENQKLKKLQKETSEYNEQILRLYVKTKRAKKKNLEIKKLVENRAPSR